MNGTYDIDYAAALQKPGCPVLRALRMFDRMSAKDQILAAEMVERFVELCNERRNGDGHDDSHECGPTPPLRIVQPA